MFDRKKYAREWVAARRKKFFQDKFCVICFATENLELDHIDPSTKISHSIWSWSEKRREEELKKCQVLCNSCHKIKTNRELINRSFKCGHNSLQESVTADGRHRKWCRVCNTLAKRISREKIIKYGPEHLEEGQLRVYPR